MRLIDDKDASGGDDSEHRHDENQGNGRSDPSQADRDAFAAMVIGHCSKLNNYPSLSYDKVEFMIRDAEGGIELSLSNFFADYHSAEKFQRHEIIAQYMGVFAKPPIMPSSFAEAKDRILPKITNRWSGDISRLDDARKGRSSPLSRTLTDNLTIDVVYVLSNGVVYLTAKILESWGVSEDEAYAVALKNMRKLMTDRILSGTVTSMDDFAAQNGVTVTQLIDVMRPLSGPNRSAEPRDALEKNRISALTFEDLGFGKVAGYPGLFGSLAEDSRSPARILVEEWIGILPVKGDPVAMITHGGTLLITGTEDAQSLLGMAEVAKFMQGHSHPVSNIPIRLTATGWETFLPPKGHPAHEAFLRLRSEEMLKLYSWQQSLLRQRPRVDEFAASCIIGDDESVCAGTVSVWSKDVDPLLPKTDWVMFGVVDPSMSSVHLVPPVPWDEAMSIVGHRVEPTEYSPPLYRAVGFPSEAELDLLREAARRAGFPLPGTETGSRERGFTRASSRRQQRHPDMPSRSHRRRGGR